MYIGYLMHDERYSFRLAGFDVHVISCTVIRHGDSLHITTNHRIPVATFRRPVGGTHQRTPCVVCGGKTSYHHGFQRLHVNEWHCMRCAINGDEA